VIDVNTKAMTRARWRIGHVKGEKWMVERRTTSSTTTIQIGKGKLNGRKRGRNDPWQRHVQQKATIQTGNHPAVRVSASVRVEEDVAQFFYSVGNPGVNSLSKSALFYMTSHTLYMDFNALT